MNAKSLLKYNLSKPLEKRIHRADLEEKIANAPALGDLAALMQNIHNDIASQLAQMRTIDAMWQRVGSCSAAYPRLTMGRI